MRRTASIAALLVLGTASVAVADIAPEPGYVEQCAMERLESRGGTGCVECATWHSDETPCAGREALQELNRCCASRGASVWTEIWCARCPGGGDGEPAEAEAAAPEPVPGAANESEAQEAEPVTEAAPEAEQEGGGGCVVSPGRRSAPLGLLVGLIGFAVLRR